MRLQFIFIFVLSFLVVKTKAQTNIQAWYKHGQVWIVWDETLPRPDVYEIYMHPTPFDAVHQATLVGKLAHWEWAAGALRDQINNTSFNWKVPHPFQHRRHQLDSLQGLFVYTPHIADSAYFAVVKRGDTLVTAGMNRTLTAVHYDYDPVNDPVICHKQASKTLDSGHKATSWAMWADGREDHWNGRPDFPIMGNQHKNGQPSVFIVSEAIGMDTTGGNTIPAVLWLHGGDGTAKQSLPSGTSSVNIEPQEGILVAHNDDFVGYHLGQLVERHSNTWFFGWAKNKDPYDPVDNAVAINDTRDIFSIFPNPSADLLHILVDSPASKSKWVTLHDFTGAIKMKFQADEVITKVNIAHLKPDTYFVKFNNKTLRFVKY